MPPALAGVPALPDWPLRLAEDAAEPARDRPGCVGRFREPAPGNGDALPGQERLGRVFLEIHLSYLKKPKDKISRR